MTNWLGVVQRDHVRRGVALGIAQTNHGERAGIQRMRPGDGLVYYSPRTTYPEGPALRCFTAIGRIADAEPYEAQEGERRPWRRRVDYVEGIRELPIAEVQAVLELTAAPNWGFALRRGQLEMTEHDFRVIAEAMGAASLVG